jgi:3-hydroxybutyryl-CoA dehydratase
MSQPKKAVGQTFQHARSCEKYTPIYYASASGDFHPFHLDREVAEAAGLGGTILQSLCVMSWATEGAVKFLGDPAKLKRVRARFSRPVRPGDTLAFEGTVVKAEGGRLTAKVTARNADGEDVLEDVLVEAQE